MTPLTDTATLVVDPGAVPGMGAVTEDPVRGLLCPIRDCGAYKHNLGRHLDARHSDMGGQRKLRALLSIPDNAPLISSAHRERLKVASAKGLARLREMGYMAGTGLVAYYQTDPAKRTHASVVRARATRTVGYKNLHDRCIAQLSNKMLDLAVLLGRSPTVRDADRELGRPLRRAIESTFGSWNAAKSAVNLETRPRGRRSGDANRGNLQYESVMDVVTMFQAYYQRHGNLPSQRTNDKGSREPYTPATVTVMRVTGASSWSGAMEQVAALLGIEGGRYGLPKQESAA